ncbi:MAG TPA: hypothetical protein VLJ59_01365 [Mycobacteriales bacterium]|nr:hypothetical protein [Mycobacteriales bacterium]
MSAPVELRTQRPLWRLSARLRPIRAGQQPRGVTLAVFLVLLLVAALVGVTAAAIFGPAGLIAVPVVLFGLPAVWFLVVFASASWYSTGAGRPVLVLAGDEVRGRLRPVWAGAPGGPDDPDWWDVRVPVTELVAVRVTHEDRDIRRRFLALDLPPELSATLAAAPELADVVPRLVTAAGSPAAWAAGTMLPGGRRQRAARLRELVEAVERARAAGGQRH